MKESTLVAASASMIVGGVALLGTGLGIGIHSAIMNPLLLPPIGISGFALGPTLSLPLIISGAVIADKDLEYEKFRETWSKRDYQSDQKEYGQLTTEPWFSERQNKTGGWYEDRQWIAYANCLKKLEVVKSDHFVFTHGQHLDWMVINILAKELLKRRGDDVKGTQVLRHPIFLSKTGSPMEYYRKECARLSGGDHNFRSQVISVDAYLENETLGSSALYFSSHRNMISVPRDRITKILRDHFTSNTRIRQIESKIIQLIRFVSRIAPREGNLYAICMPKEKFKTAGWISHPLGRPCRCPNREQDETKRVGNLQAGQMKLCRGWRPPQARLLTSHLTKANGVTISCFSTLNKTQKDFIKRRVRQILEANPDF